LTGKGEKELRENSLSLSVWSKRWKESGNVIRGHSVRVLASHDFLNYRLRINGDRHCELTGRLSIGVKQSLEIAREWFDGIAMTVYMKKIASVAQTILTAKTSQ